MSFLRVNGWGLPCDTIARLPIEIGVRERSFGGVPFVGRRTVKGSWKGRMTRQLPSVARAIEGALLGLGEAFPYDSGLYSHGGLNIAGSTGTIIPGVAGDDLIIYEESTGETESKFGAGALTVTDGAVNMLPADSRDAENAPAGYSAVNAAVLAADTTHYVETSKGLEVTAGAAGRGVLTSATGAAAAVDYVASVYIYSAAAGSVQVELTETGVQRGTKTVSLAGGQWDRVEVTGTAAGGGFMAIRITAVGGALVFTCDMFQVELGTIATPWVDGTRAAESLQYPSIFTGYDMTFAAWTRGQATVPGANAVLFYGRVTGSSANTLRVFRLTGTNTLRVTHIGSDLSSGSISVANVFDGDWHHIAVTVESVGDAAAAITRVYVDGVEEDSSSLVEITPPSWDVFYVGSDGNEWWAGIIDDVVVTPYAMVADQIAALYAMGKAMSPLSRIYVDGNFINAPLLTQLAVGGVPSAPYMVGGVAGVFHADLQETEFTIDAI